jgi:subtilisin family serine protease
MGIKAIELAPLAANGVTAQTPPAKDVRVKYFQLARTDTVAAVKMVLPANSSILDVKIIGTASDAGTTATVSVGTTSSSNEIVTGQDVKGAGTVIRPTTAGVGSGFAAVESIPQVGDIPIYAKYAETGTVSTVGGPWKVFVEFIN